MLTHIIEIYILNLETWLNNSMGFKVFSEVNDIKGFLDPLEGEDLY